MSIRTMQSGDTYPPLRGRAEDESGLVNLPAAVSMRMIAVGETHKIVLQADVIDPPLEIDGEFFNWEALFNDSTETSVPDTYLIQLEVTWAPGTVETFPNARVAAPVLIIEQANEST